MQRSTHNKGTFAVALGLVLAGCGQTPDGAASGALLRSKSVLHKASAVTSAATTTTVTPGKVVVKAGADVSGNATMTLRVTFDAVGYAVLAADAARPDRIDQVVIELRHGNGPDAPVAARVTVTRDQARQGVVDVQFQGFAGGGYDALVQDQNAAGMVMRSVDWAVQVEGGQQVAIEPPILPPAQAIGPDEAIPAPRPDVPAAPAAPLPGNPAAPGAAPGVVPGVAPVDLGPAVAGRMVPVPAGSDLQAAINAAVPGDTLVLDAGATYTGSFTLPVKQGDGYVTLTTSGAAKLPGVGQRVKPENASAMAKIVSPGQGLPAIATRPGAHHYKLVGLELTQASADAVVYDLLQLGSAGADQSTLDQVPHHLSVDRCYLHALPDGSLKRGIQLNSASTEITNCCLMDFKVAGQDSQAIGSWNGPGPFKIVNNELDGAGENVLFGGADPSIPNLIPSDIEFRRNHVTKPLAWHGSKWSVKNLFELKNAQRVVIEGNRFENNWADAQAGFAIVFTPRDQDGNSPWSTVRDVSFVHNIVAHSGSAVNVLGQDNLHTSAPIAHLTIAGNLFDDISSQTYGGAGTFFQLGEGGSGVVVDHNTVLNTGNAGSLYGKPTQGLVFTNNIVVANAYGLHGDGTGSGTSALTAFAPGAVFGGNAIVGATAGDYPAGNFFPVNLDAVGFLDRPTAQYRLRGDSPLRSRGTDGHDVGADFDALALAMNDLNNVPID